MFLIATASLIWQPATAQTVRAEVLTNRLDRPWGVAFLPGGKFLVTERPGRLRVVSERGEVGAPVAGLPAIDARGQGGLLDVVTDSGFAQNRTIHFCYSEAGEGGNSTALASAKLSADEKSLEGARVVFSQKPKFSSTAHFGCRIVEAKDGTLFLTLGDRFNRMQDAQTLGNHHGKVVRVNKDGSVPKDNPFVGRTGALPEIWSYGHRNSQGAALAPDGTLWTHEHGPQGGDEVNTPKAGLNYGWPVITYGENYGGGPIGEGLTAKAGLEQPAHHWPVSPAISGMAFLTSDRYGAAWKGDLFVGALKLQKLMRLDVDGGKVVRESPVEIAGLRARIRDVRQGPDGLLYLLTDESDGKLVRLQPGG